MARIKIKFLSDLCPGSGQGFSSGIDADVCYDAYGFPYIPARRIKGCLREAARYIGLEEEKIAALFGVTGAHQSGGLKLSNAVLKDYDAMVEELAAGKANVKPRELLELFTYTRAQTAIEDEHAKDNSLRFTRVIKQYSPLDGKPLEFFAQCADDSESEDELIAICSAFRHMGLMRSRGLGVVRCEYLPDTAAANSLKSASNPPLEDHRADPRGDATIEYVVRLKDSLMISGASDMESIEYIAGTSVLGALARIYLSRPGSAADEPFAELFLRDKVKYSNLYISDREGRACVPAPMFLGKLKLARSGERPEYRDGQILSFLDEHDGQLTIKPLKGGYCDEEFRPAPVLTETVYHHQRGDDGILYTQNCIVAGQYFRGTIHCAGEQVDLLTPLLASGDLRFGRSKTAQYSLCQLVSLNIFNPPSVEVRYNPGEPIILALESDLLLTGADGLNTVNIDRLRECIAEQLHIAPDSLPAFQPQTAFQFKTVTGYNAQWNLRKPALRAFSAGSALVLTAPREVTCAQRFSLGEKQAEGCGVIRAYRQEEIALAPVGETEENAASRDRLDQVSNPTLQSIVKQIQRNRDVETMRADAIALAHQQRKNFTENRLNAALVGRVSLMIDQADSFDNLIERVDSIKSKDKKAIIMELLDPIMKLEPQQSNYLYWREYFRLVFTLGKYFLKTSEGGNANG